MNDNLDIDTIKNNIEKYTYYIFKYITDIIINYYFISDGSKYKNYNISNDDKSILEITFNIIKKPQEEINSHIIMEYYDDIFTQLNSKLSLEKKNNIPDLNNNAYELINLCCLTIKNYINQIEIDESKNMKTLNINDFNNYIKLYENILETYGLAHELYIKYINSRDTKIQKYRVNIENEIIKYLKPSNNIFICNNLFFPMINFDIIYHINFIKIYNKNDKNSNKLCNDSNCNLPDSKFMISFENDKFTSCSLNSYINKKNSYSNGISLDNLVNIKYINKYIKNHNIYNEVRDIDKFMLKYINRYYAIYNNIIKNNSKNINIFFINNININENKNNSSKLLNLINMCSEINLTCLYNFKSINIKKLYDMLNIEI